MSASLARLASRPGAFASLSPSWSTGGHTVGRHYLGPSWALTDGSMVQGKLAASTPGATPADVALLKLGVVAHLGSGALSKAATVLRLNTRGGALAGPCPGLGDLRPVSYSADYVFLR